MPRYFFDTDDGTNRFDDQEGLELADDEAARDEGTRFMGELAKDSLPRVKEPQKNIAILVRNDAGDTILQLALTFAVHRH